MPSIVRWLLVGTVVILLGLQLVRFVAQRFDPDNPPVTHTVEWNSPETEQLWQQACADCHSNETRYPFYSYIAPVGWLVMHDVREGRSHLNVSEGRGINAEEMVEVIEDGEMPLPLYLPLHPEANLSDEQKTALIAGLQATFGGSDGEIRESGEHDAEGD